MKARHVCAVLGLAIAAGTVVFMRALVASNDAQAETVATRLLQTVPVEPSARTMRATLDFRPDGRVLQGPPLRATFATAADLAPSGEVAVTRALFSQRRLETPPVGTTLTFLGRKGAYRLKLAKIIEWDRPLRGYPNAFVSPETAAAIGEEWTPYVPQTAAELAPGFRSDAGRNFDRARGLLLWAAALTALCLLVNTLFLSVEAKRRDYAILRVLGLTRGGLVRKVWAEAFKLSLIGYVVGAAGASAAVWAYTAWDAALFPEGCVLPLSAFLLSGALTFGASFVAALAALRPALAVKPLEAASFRPPRHRPWGMMLSFALGFGAFVAVEVWGASLTKAFVPSKEWPDAIVSILPGGVSSFDIEKLRKLEGVRRISELQPLQVNLLPLEELKGRGGTFGGGRGKAYRNALLLASDYVPPFRFVAGDRAAATNALFAGDACLITEMMARARHLSLGDSLQLDCGRGFVLSLKVAGIVDLNWHMVTSRGLVRGLNRMPVNTDGPVFVSFDTLAAADRRPQEFVHMTHLWLDYEPDFLAQYGVFEAGRRVEKEIVSALNGANLVTKEGEVRGNTVRLHARDEVAEGTLAHGNDLVGSMARIPFIFVVVVSLGFISLLVADADARRKSFAVLRAIGATRAQLAWILAVDALKVAGAGLVLGLAGGSLTGWLCTFATRKMMANWGLPAGFAVPWGAVGRGACLAFACVVLLALPVAWTLVCRAMRRR